MPEQIKIKRPETPVSNPIDSTVENISLPENDSGTEREAPTEQAKASLGAMGPGAGTPSTIPSEQVQRLADIERILEEDLSDIYFKLPASDQANFRLKGEETAREINTLLSATTIKLKKIIEAITSWLKLIPGVSKFFLEQEAKIKADRLLKLHNDR